MDWITRIVVLHNGDEIEWIFKRQAIVAMSATEADYIAMTETA